MGDHFFVSVPTSMPQNDKQNRSIECQTGDSMFVPEPVAEEKTGAKAEKKRGALGLISRLLKRSENKENKETNGKKVGLFYISLRANTHFADLDFTHTHLRSRRRLGLCWTLS